MRIIALVPGGRVYRGFPCFSFTAAVFLLIKIANNKSLRWD
jgi:hypothetical protein